MSLEGAVVLVTGGGRGIGRAVALEAGRRGAKVAIAARTQSEIEAVAEEIRTVGASVLSLVADVSNSEDVSRMVEGVGESFGPIDVLVNNAGVFARGEVAQLDVEVWERVLDVNLKGTFLCSKAVLPSMIERGCGRIVNVSSVSGTTAAPGRAAYCASKWGVIGFTKSLAEEVKGNGVVVTCVLPGSVDTRMLTQAGYEPDMTAEDVAGTILYLAGDAPAAMTGSAVEIFA